jgi:hypothetical protein
MHHTRAGVTNEENSPETGERPGLFSDADTRRLDRARRKETTARETRPDAQRPGRGTKRYAAASTAH